MIKSLVSKVTPFGGLHIIHKLLASKKFAEFIDSELGSRVKTVGYDYSSIVLTRIYTTLCGGTATEDVNYIGEHTLNELRNFKAPSADTILRADSELATPCVYIETDSDHANKVNINNKMNELLIRSTKYLDVLESDSEELVYDFDHQFINAEKYDATYSYKKERGYFPGVVSINDVPVHIEGRNGNCHVKTDQLATHKRAIAALHKEDIYPKYARMDAGSYIQEVTDFFDNQNIVFTIRAMQSPYLLKVASESENWHNITIGYQDMEATTLAYLFGQNVHRIVAYRVPNKTGQANINTSDACKYMFIITNDWDKSDQQIISFYNQRGASEKVFDVQNNDFNWKHMPHSFLEQNTVYLIIMAIAHIVYKWLIKSLSILIDGLSPKARLKQFIFRFVTTVAKVTKSGRRHIISLATMNHKLIQYINSS